MNWRNVKLIFLREVRDQLRDRRTLFMVAILPLLLYPALGVGSMQLMAMFSDQTRTVALLGSKNLPQPDLLDSNGIAPAWFRSESDASRLRVVTDSPRPGATPEQDEKSLKRQEADEQLLEQSRQIAQEIEQAKQVERELTDAEQAVATIRERISKGESAAEADLPPAEQRLATLQRIFQEKRDAISELFTNTQAQVIVLIPDGFRQRVEAQREQLRKRGTETVAAPTADYPRPEILYNKADDKSLLAFNRISHAMEAWEQGLVASQLKEAGLPETLSRPVKPKAINVATDTQAAASGWAKILPALLVIMAVTGAFYPAIDMCAGEKERGTMETLLICPASRTEIVLGKFAAVMAFSSATALLNLASMGLTGQHVFSMSQAGGALGKLPDLSLPTLPAMAWLVVLLIPLSSLFSALSLSFATFARSSKEGQYYLTPLLMVTLGLTVFCMSPGVELTPIYSVTPIVGVALLLKALLLTPLNGGLLYLYALPVLATSFAYSALALWWAIDQFNREDVLFREAERLDVSLWVKHLLRDKEPTPSFTEAGFCFVLIMLLQFAAMKAFSRASLIVNESNAHFPPAIKILLIQQLAIIACPALMMGIMLTTSMRRTFRLNLPDPKTLGAAIILPMALLPLAIELKNRVAWFFQGMNVDDVLKNMLSEEMPLWLTLLAFAIAPAICEELAFRGFVLSGFNNKKRTWLAIVLSSAAFGIMHMVPYQVFNAFLMGLVLGMLAIRGNSLLVCILFHVINNSVSVLLARYASEIAEQKFVHWIAKPNGGTIQFTPLALVLSASVAIPLIYWLVSGVQQKTLQRIPEMNPETAAPPTPVAPRPVAAPRMPVHSNHPGPS